MSKDKLEKSIDSDVENVEEELLDGNEQNGLMCDVKNDSKDVKNKNIIVAILVAMLAFLIVYSSITVVQTVMENDKEEIVDKEDIEEFDDSDNIDNEVTSNDVIDIPNKDNLENDIVLTNEMKKEILGIANISNNKQGYCFTPYLFMNYNGNVVDFEVDNKRTIIRDYAVMNSFYDEVDSYIAISESNYNIIAAKYGFIESFDEMFSGFEKKNDMYVYPPSGCTGPEYLVHDLSYESYDGNVFLYDNVSIVNSNSNEKNFVKVKYKFSYLNNSFKLVQVNSER